MFVFCRRLSRLGTIRRKLSTAALLALPILIFQPYHSLAQLAAKTARKVLIRIDPDYPQFLKNGHFEGRVVVEATVLPNGNVSKVEIKGGNPMFSEFASKAVLKWKYAPAPSQTVEEVNFVFTQTPR